MLQTRGILEYNQQHMGNPCGEYISDKEFLKHMIPHHQIAIDNSKKILETTKDPNIKYLAHNIVFKQSDEILYMENVLLSGIPNMGSKDKAKVEIIPNQFTIYYPEESRADDYQCGLHHFSKHAKGHSHNKYKDCSIKADETFLKNMIYHHDVAIEMSNRITKHSNNPSMIEFAYEIIKSQRSEIWQMKHLLKSLKQCSQLI